MEIMKILIIGGVAGGATAAARLRRMDEKAEIILFERDRPFLQTADGFKSRFNIDVRNRSEVISINPKEKTASVHNLSTSNEVEFITRSMSMDIMGIKKKELMDGITIGGVATYLDRVENANVNLFI
jgi:Uncharacterized conserved protein